MSELDLEGCVPQEEVTVTAKKKEPKTFAVSFFEGTDMEERPWAISTTYRYTTNWQFTNSDGNNHEKGKAFPKDIVNPPKIEYGDRYHRTYSGCKNEDPNKRYIHVEGHWRSLPMEVLDRIGKYAVVKVYGWVESYYGEKETHSAKYWLVDTSTWLVLIECLAGRSARRARRLLKAEAAVRHGRDLLAPPEYDDDEDEWS